LGRNLIITIAPLAGGAEYEFKDEKTAKSNKERSLRLVKNARE
jgi:hypothetical protein